MLWNLPIDEIFIYQKLGFAIIKIEAVADFAKIFQNGIGRNSISLGLSFKTLYCIC